MEPDLDVCTDFPDVYDLLQVYNQCFFDGRLAAVELKWSKRMTLCAGVCAYKDGLVSIRLSEPLLKLRPVSDLYETLLHEMIHAYLMVIGQAAGRDGHGAPFLVKMYEINLETGLNITVYHSFHDEVEFYRGHVWRCDGPCRDREPFFGYVKRAMNRAPSEKDYWWARHKSECSGTFIKEAEPQKPPKVHKRKRPVEPMTVTKFFKPLPREQKN